MNLWIGVNVAQTVHALRYDARGSNVYVSVCQFTRTRTQMTVIGESIDKVEPARCQRCRELSVSDNEDERGIHDIIEGRARSSDCWP